MTIQVSVYVCLCMFTFIQNQIVTCTFLNLCHSFPVQVHFQIAFSLRKIIQKRDTNMFSEIGNERKLNWIFENKNVCMCKVCVVLIWHTKVLMSQLFSSQHVKFFSIFQLIHFWYFSPVPPMVWIQNQLVGSAIGQTISLECQSEAYPKSINYWMKNETIITLGKFVSIWSA